MNLDTLLNKKNYTQEDVIDLLQVLEPAKLEKLFKKADEVRRKYCGDEVHIRAIVEISNHCEDHCIYCGLQEENHSISRYRMIPEEIIESAQKISNLGISTIILSSGKDSFFDTDLIAYLIYSIKQKTDLAVTLGLGERTFDEYRAWKIAGADRYILKHGTADPSLYLSDNKNHPPVDRMEHLKMLKSLGYQIASGNLVGLPKQTVEDIAKDILLCKELDADIAEFSPFISAASTPYEDKPNGDFYETLKVIAATRIVLRDVHIPATLSLDTLMQGGREKAINCGANIIMPDFTPFPYRKYFNINDGKKGVSDDPFNSHSKFQNRLELIGRRISSSKGDSLKQKV